MSFYAIPSVHRQKDVPIRPFSMALQSLLKGESLYRVFLDVWKALTLKPDSGSVRHAITEPFDDSILHHPICPPPKGRPHTTILHGATESSKDSGSVRHLITGPFYDGVLRHPIYSPPKGRPYTGIFHGATESSEGGIPGDLAMRSRNPLTMAFYAIPSIHHQKDVPTQVFSMALQSLLKGGSLFWVFLDIWKALTLKPDSRSVRHAITEPFNDGVLRHPICQPPKGSPHTSILHGATESSEGGVLMPGFFRCLESADFKPRIRERWACDHGALLKRLSTPSHLSTAKRTSPYEHSPWHYRVL
ncbi:hypothetical protein B9Z19DRAFT_1134970 [Tuber borchii]|uniref:Uncharacterized protein n=1 Tax=Tuber borchii TaxID=42251 RepID=A0A2T6ZDH6_TUBBO|nr:hypothetical protein B9Z19DRAFT_1134970 [Tuber borchii]